jgi:hypothetical protein
MIGCEVADRHALSYLRDRLERIKSTDTDDLNIIDQLLGIHVTQKLLMLIDDGEKDPSAGVGWVLDWLERQRENYKEQDRLAGEQNIVDIRAYYAQMKRQSQWLGRLGWLKVVLQFLSLPLPLFWQPPKKFPRSMQYHHLEMGAEILRRSTLREQLRATPASILVDRGEQVLEARAMYWYWHVPRLPSADFNVLSEIYRQRTKAETAVAVARALASMRAPSGEGQQQWLAERGLGELRECTQAVADEWVHRAKVRRLHNLRGLGSRRPLHPETIDLTGITVHWDDRRHSARRSIVYAKKPGALVGDKLILLGFKGRVHGLVERSEPLFDGPDRLPSAWRVRVLITGP